MAPYIQVSFAPLASFMADDPPFPLDAFHTGDRTLLARCYQDHFAAVEQAVGSLLSGADKETVVQDIFVQMLSDAAFRLNFQGGSLGAWLNQIARNRAIDYRRRVYDRERTLESAGLDREVRAQDMEARLDARAFLSELRRRLPAKWLPVFEARFVRGLSQREAAESLGLSRTTLAYQDLQIRRVLRRCLRKGEIG